MIIVVAAAAVVIVTFTIMKMSIQTKESSGKTAAVTSWVTDPSQAKSLLQVVRHELET